MKTFEISFKYETWANYTVEATDQAEAENIALGMLQRDEGDYLHTGEWTDTTIEELGAVWRVYTPEGEPLTTAYSEDQAKHEVLFYKQQTGKTATYREVTA